jgi:hypothetical protein
MNADEVTLGGAAVAYAMRAGLSISDVKEARAGSVSELGGSEYKILIGTIPDGRSIRLVCRYDVPGNVVTCRLI